MENKTSKYFKYAIGEILLVLIGILLALAISDWNSNRIDGQSEILKLTELRKSIETDLNLISAKQIEANNSIERMTYLQSLIKNENYVYKKSLDTLFGCVYGMRILNLNDAFYEDLKSDGLSLIKEENIRLKIVQLFEGYYAHIKWINNLEMSINEVSRPYYLSNFHNLSFVESATPNDFKFIWHDKYYHNVIDYRLITLEKNQVIYYEDTKLLMKDLIMSIDNYLIENQ
jgi:hypothetical protein